MPSRNTLFIILGAVLIGGFLIYYVTSDRISIITDKKDYEQNGILRINIENESDETICFSSCYPYYLQKKDAEWKNYEYGKCPNEDVAQYCVSQKDLKGFAIYLFSYEIENAVHRLAIPACIGCAQGEAFREDTILYSNDFEVN